MVSDSQINTIKSKQTLLGWDFTLNDDREIDMASFELVGVIPSIRAKRMMLFTFILRLHKENYS